MAASRIQGCAVSPRHAVRNSWRHKTNFDGRQSVPAVYVLPMPGDDVQRTARKERLAARIQPPGGATQRLPVLVFLPSVCHLSREEGARSKGDEFLGRLSACSPAVQIEEPEREPGKPSKEPKGKGE